MWNRLHISQDPWYDESPCLPQAAQSQALALGATIMLPGQVLQTTERPEQNGVESDRAPEAVEILNDVEAAIEVNLGKGFQPLYPGRSLTFMGSESTVIEVRLRDDHSIHGRRSHPDMLLRVADAFGGFGENVAHFLERQKCLVQRERESQKTRHSKLEKAVWRKCKEVMCRFNFLWAVSFLTMIGLLVISFDFEEVMAAMAATFVSGPLRPFYFTMLSIGALISWGTSSLCAMWSLLRIASFRKVRAELLGGRGVKVPKPTKGMKGDPSKWQNRLSAFQVFLNTSIILALAIQLGEMRFYLGVLILLLPLICFSCIAIPALGEWGPFEDRFVTMFGRIYLGQVCQGTIVFEGSVLPASPCICSWPGKYESAWETLVKCSREGTLSAAVVFLPGGSEHFGTHDWKEAVGVCHYMVNRSLGAVGGGAVGFKTLRRRWRKMPNCRCITLATGKGKARLSPSPLLVPRTCAEKRLIKGGKTSNAPPSLRRRDMKA